MTDYSQLTLKDLRDPDLTSRPLYKASIEPPEKLSDLIDLALIDIGLVEKRDDVVINMGEWLTPGRYYSAGKCAACFGGSVMIETLKAPLDVMLAPENFTERWQSAIHCLNNIRKGEIETAMQRWLTALDGEGVRFHDPRLAGLPDVWEPMEVIDPDDEDGDRITLTYEADPERWKRHMKEIADFLRTKGH